MEIARPQNDSNEKLNQILDVLWELKKEQIELNKKLNNIENFLKSNNNLDPYKRETETNSDSDTDFKFTFNDLNDLCLGC